MFVQKQYVRRYSCQLAIVLLLLAPGLLLAQTAAVTVIKNSVPNSSAQFGFTTTGGTANLVDNTTGNVFANDISFTGDGKLLITSSTQGVYTLSNTSSTFNLVNGSLLTIDGGPSNNVFVGAGLAGGIFGTTNGGTAYTSFPGGGALDVASVSATTHFITTTAQQIYYFDGTSYILRNGGLSRIDYGGGRLAGAHTNGTVFYSIDGGATYTQISPAGFGYDVAVSPQGFIYVTDQLGYVKRYLSGTGASAVWQTLPFPPADARNITADPHGYPWIVANDGTIAVWTGTSWHRLWVKNGTPTNFVNYFNLAAGSFSATENLPGGGYGLASITHEGTGTPNTNLVTRNSTLTLAAGSRAFEIFENRIIPTCGTAESVQPIQPFEGPIGLVPLVGNGAYAQCNGSPDFSPNWGQTLAPYVGSSFVGFHENKTSANGEAFSVPFNKQLTSGQPYTLDYMTAIVPLDPNTNGEWREADGGRNSGSYQVYAGNAYCNQGQLIGTVSLNYPSDVDWQQISLQFTASGNWTHITFEAATVAPAGTFGYRDLTYFGIDNILADWSDAPDTYGTIFTSNGPRHYLTSGTSLAIGSVAPDVDSDGTPGGTANGDDVTASNDENTFTAANFSTLTTQSTAFSLNVPVINNSGAAATLIGWIDFDADGKFQTDEAVSVAVPNGATSVTLNWSNLNSSGANVVQSTSNTYARFRIYSGTIQADNPATTLDERSQGVACNGEVEDYQLTILCQLPTVTPSITSTTICTGQPVSVTFTTTPANQEVRWFGSDGSAGVGTMTVAPTNNTTSPITVTYTAITGVFSCTAMATTTITVNPKPTITPSQCSQTICSGDTGNITFLSNIPGETIHWTRTPTTPAPSSGTGNIGQSFTNTGPTSLTYTYTIWADYAGTVSCATSNTITCTIVVDVCTICSLTAVAGTPVCDPGNATYSVSVTATGATGLNASSGTVSGTAPVFTVSGILAGVDVILTPIGSCTNVSPITVTAPNCCSIATPIASVTSQPICNQPTGTITVTSPLTGVTYSFDGGLTFQASNVKSGLAAGTNYNIVVKDNITGCLSEAVTLTVNPVGNLRASASSNSPVCSGNLLQLIASQTGGSGTITYSWAGPNGFVSTLQNPSIASPTAAAGGSYTVTVTDATCSVTATTAVTIATQPDLVISGSPSLTICSNQPTVLNVTGDGGANVTWTNTLGESGTGTTINFGGIANISGQPQTIIYSIKASAGGCSDDATVVLTINPAPALQVIPSQAVICALEKPNIVANSFPNTATIDWTRTPAIPAPASGTGTGSVTINDVLPAGTYTYTFTATEGGCTSAPVTVPLVVNN